jgi:hypothetical protein
MNVIGISGLDNGIRFKKREFPASRLGSIGSPKDLTLQRLW